MDGTLGLVWPGWVDVTGWVRCGAGTGLLVGRAEVSLAVWELGLDGKVGLGNPCCGKLYLKQPKNKFKQIFKYLNLNWSSRK